MQRLMLFGGGRRSPLAIKKFCSWVENSSIMVVTWASSESKRSAKTLERDFRCAGIENVMVSLRPKHLDQFRKNLSQAGGVFFSGGDQNHIADALERDPATHSALLEAYARGVAFGGTSAGTAIMSEVMISGDAPDGLLIRRGLGAIKQAILDQHFMKRNRFQRLVSAVSVHPHLVGIGVDEDAAVAIESNRIVSPVGPGRAVVTYSRETPSMECLVLESGGAFDLNTRRVLFREVEAISLA